MEGKVYLVTFADWDEFQVIEAFASKADAEALADHLNRGQGAGAYDVDEFIVHQGPVKPLPYAEAEFWTDRPRRIHWQTTPKETILSSEYEGPGVRVDDFSDTRRNPKSWNRVYRITVSGSSREEVKEIGRTELARLREEIGRWNFKVSCRGCSWQGTRRGTSDSEVVLANKCPSCKRSLEVQDRLERVVR